MSSDNPASGAAGRLEELSAKAGEGEWFVRKRPTDDGLAVIEDGLAYGIFPITGEWPQIEFIVDLVNTYRAGVFAEPGLRNLRLRLEAALENRTREGDHEAVSWLTDGMRAVDSALLRFAALSPATAPSATGGNGTAMREALEAAWSYMANLGLQVRSNVLDLGRDGISYLDQLHTPEMQPGEGDRLITKGEAVLAQIEAALATSEPALGGEEAVTYQVFRDGVPEGYEDGDITDGDRKAGYTSRPLYALRDRPVASADTLAALREAITNALDGHTAYSRDCHLSGEYLCSKAWPLVEAALAQAEATSTVTPDRELDGKGERAARDVLAERERQKTVEGWSPEHDDEHSKGELAWAAACYALVHQMHNPPKACWPGNEMASAAWPWAFQWWKPTTPRRNLVKAGALILAEIERLDRSEQCRRQGQSGCIAGVGCDEYGACYAEAHGEPETCPFHTETLAHSTSTGGENAR